MVVSGLSDKLVKELSHFSFIGQYRDRLFVGCLLMKCAVPWPSGQVLEILVPCLKKDACSFNCGRFEIGWGMSKYMQYGYCDFIVITGIKSSENWLEDFFGFSSIVNICSCWNVALVRPSINLSIFKWGFDIYDVLLITAISISLFHPPRHPRFRALVAPLYIVEW